MKIAWLIQESLGVIQENLTVLEIIRRFGERTDKDVEGIER